METIDWVNLIIYTQPFLFGLLYQWKQRIEPWYIYLAGLFGAYIAYLTGGIGFYTPDIISIYILMVCFLVYYYDSHGLSGFKPVSLAFLLVFLNSFFWEFPIHIVSLFTGFDVPHFIVQSLHLMPLLFLREYSEIHARTRKEIISFVTTFWIIVSGAILFSWWIQGYYLVINHILRVLGILVLGKIFRVKSQFSGKDEVIR